MMYLLAIPHPKRLLLFLEAHVYETHADAEVAADAVNRARKHHGYPPVSVYRIEAM